MNIYFYCDCIQIPAKGLKGGTVSFGSEQTTLGNSWSRWLRSVQVQVGYVCDSEGIRGSREMGRPALFWLSTFPFLFCPDLLGGAAHSQCCPPQLGLSGKAFLSTPLVPVSSGDSKSYQVGNED